MFIFPLKKYILRVWLWAFQMLMKSNKVIIFSSFIFIYCAMPWDIVRERNMLDDHDKKILFQKGNIKPCSKEFYIQRMKINSELSRKNHYGLAEQKECSLYFEILFVNENYYLNKVVIISNENERVFEDLDEVLSLTELSGGYKISVSWSINNEKYLFDIFLKNSLPDAIFYEIR